MQQLIGKYLQIEILDFEAPGMISHVKFSERPRETSQDTLSKDGIIVNAKLKNINLKVIYLLLCQKLLILIKEMPSFTSTMIFQQFMQWMELKERLEIQ